MAGDPAPGLSASLLFATSQLRSQACAIPRSTRLTTSAVSAGQLDLYGLAARALARKRPEKPSASHCLNTSTAREASSRTTGTFCFVPIVGRGDGCRSLPAA